MQSNLRVGCIVFLFLMPSTNNSSKTLLNILQWNTRSLSARLINIPHILSSNSVSVALFSETWLLPNRRINIPGYRLVRGVRDLMALVASPLPLKIPSSFKCSTSTLNYIGYFLVKTLT